MTELERIWAPWRLQYVKEPNKGDGCFLCRAAEQDQDEENLVLWRSDNCFAMLNRWPYNNGHIMVAPFSHKGDFLELSDEELGSQMGLLRRCRKNLEAALGPDGFNMGLNEGGAAGAGLVGHLHWHIVPRWYGDSNFMPALASTKIIPQSLEELWVLLREIDSD